MPTPTAGGHSVNTPTSTRGSVTGSRDVTGGATLSIQSVVSASDNTVTINFSTAPYFAGPGTPAAYPAQWTVDSTDVSAAPVTVNSVTVNASSVILSTSGLTNGKAYTVHVPGFGLFAKGSGIGYTGNLNQAVTGASTVPHVSLIRVVDAETIDVVYDKAMNPTSATAAAAYTINNGLTVISASQISAYIYRLKTSQQVNGTTYTVTVGNVLDLLNNPVA